MENEIKNNRENIDLSNMPDNTVKKPEDEQDEQKESEQVFAPGTPIMVKWVIKLSGGLIKSVTVANCVLIMSAVIIFIISLYLFYVQLTPKKVIGPPPEFLRQMQQQGIPPLPTNNSK